jgi:hypothetical protein
MRREAFRRQWSAAKMPLNGPTVSADYRKPFSLKKRCIFDRLS